MNPDPPDLAAWRQILISRRRILLGLAGGSLAAMFGISTAAGATFADTQRWQLLDIVQQHLFPSEPGIPGAREINALAYLRFVVGDPKVDQEQRDFILQGAIWLQELALQNHTQAFVELAPEQREQLLQQTARSRAGENWLSTLVLYVLEALLSAPAYGGNPDGIGWRWLQHTPGFPLPDTTHTYPNLANKA